MWACRAIVEVEDGLVDAVTDAVMKEYPGSSTVRIERAWDATYATFHIRTRETCNAVDARLRGMRGASVLLVSDIRAEVPASLRTRSFWTVVAMSAAWAGFLVAGLVPDSPVLLLNPAQALVIQTTFTLAVAALVYVRGREAARHAEGQIDRVYALASEINERVKAQGERGR